MIVVQGRVSLSASSQIVFPDRPQIIRVANILACVFWDGSLSRIRQTTAHSDGFQSTDLTSLLKFAEPDVPLVKLQCKSQQPC